MNAPSARNVWTAASKFLVMSRGTTEYGETLRCSSGTAMIEKYHLDELLISIVVLLAKISPDLRLLVKLI